MTVTKFADMRDLGQLRASNLTVSFSESAATTTIGGIQMRTTQINVSNESPAVALSVNLRLQGQNGKAMLPVIFSDNYLSLTSGEHRVVIANHEASAGPVLEVLAESYGARKPLKLDESAEEQRASWMKD